MNETLCSNPDLLKELIKTLNTINEFAITLNKNVDMMNIETMN